MQEIRPAFHTFKDPCFPFFAQFHEREAGFCHKAHKGFRFMGVQAIAYKCPRGLRVCPFQCFYGFHKILFCACGVKIRHFHTACCNIKEPDEAGRAMAKIYSNSILAHWPGNGSLSGYLCSSACTPVISSAETMCTPFRFCSWALFIGQDCPYLIFKLFRVVLFNLPQGRER